MPINDTPGYVPYIEGDDTRAWVENIRRSSSGILEPNVVLRVATDSNYILNHRMKMPAYAHPAQTKAVMNLSLPGMRIPHLLNWSVSESLDNPVQTANFEMVNALSVSDTFTTLTSTLPQLYHDLTIEASYAADSEGVVTKIPGNVQVEDVRDFQGIYYREHNVRYRTFQPQTFTVQSSAGLPDPGIPTDEDGNDVQVTYEGYMSTGGVGSYFVQIGNEVVRVAKLVGNQFWIPPGGRAINGVLDHHNPGERVTLLGYAGAKGESTGFGYLSVDDYKPYKHLLRPGTCLVSYEGYGDFPSQLSHSVNHFNNYVFTGYWFVKGLESSLGEDMTPRLRVDLVSAGELLNKQKITPDLVQRVRNQFGQWRTRDPHTGELQGIFGAADHHRNIPGDWVDYHNWDPTLKDSYPLAIKTEFAQHKEFFEHMRETNFGLECEICRQERKEFLRNHDNPDKLREQHANMSNGPGRTKLGQRISDLELLQAKMVGRHIYKQSIRVIQEDGGPIKTYIRLMATLAAAAWDHPAYGTELAQRFTKLPNRLFDNMKNVKTGLVYNGSVDFSTFDKVDWSKPGYQDEHITNNKRELTCPFESTYDKAPFYQPMMDLADVNGNQFWIDREGRPCFMPQSWPMRPYGPAVEHLSNNTQKFQWNMKHGASISAYSHSVNTEQIVTQCWVTATTAFDSTFTVASGGTGFKSGGERVVYSPLAGNKEGLALTGGVQQVETVSMENQVLGLDWNTKPERFGLMQVLEGDPGDPDRTMVLNAKPALYDGSPPVSKGSKAKTAIKRIQKMVNFFLIRRLIPQISHNNRFYYTIHEDGNYGPLTEKGVVDVLTYVRDESPDGQRPYQVPQYANVEGSSLAAINGNIDGKAWGRGAYVWVKHWLDNLGAHFVKTDIWWYVHNGREWEEYVGAITGIQVPVKTKGSVKRKQRTDPKSLDESLYQIDEIGLQEEVGKWQRNFTQLAVNVGNKVVDNSLNNATVRSISTNYADPRVQPGDTIWCEVPGHLSTTNMFGRDRPPFTNGIYVTQVQRQMDLLGGTYTASYSGYRYRGDFASSGYNLLSTGFNYFLGAGSQGVSP